MKINVEIDLTPEELRRFMGLPDVQGWQQEMLEQFTNNIQSSQEQQQEFVRNMLTGAFTPWQNFFTAMGRASSSKKTDS